MIIDFNLLPFRKGSLWGYINEDFNIIIEPQFKLAFPFVGEYAKVQIDDNYKFKNSLTKYIRGEQYGFITKQGKFVIEPEFYYADDIKNGIAKVVRYRDSDYCGNSYQLIRLSGEKVNHVYRFNQIEIFSNGFWITEYGRSPVGKDYCSYLFKILDSNGKEVFDFIKFPFLCWPQRIFFSDFESGILKAEAWGKTYFINEEGEIILQSEVTLRDISCNVKGKYLYRKEGKYGIVDIEKRLVTKPQFDELLNEKFVSTEVFFTTSPTY
jgi:hypothetical protein